MPKILYQNGVALLDGRRGNEQVIRWQDIALCRLLAFDLADQKCGLNCDWMKRNKTVTGESEISISPKLS